MTIAELLADAFGRIGEVVHEAVDGLTAGQLAFRPDDQANSVAWLIWHLTRRHSWSRPRHQRRGRQAG